MGNRLQHPADSNCNSHTRRPGSNNRRVSLGKNKPLRKISIQWCSQFPLTASQLQRKRDEFWDTAPAFDGRIEIWNALKAAAEFLDQDDQEMAQAIIDGADIMLPTGTLCDCYDRLGTRYQLPLYVLSEPSNLLQDEPPSEGPIISSPPLETSTVTRSLRNINAAACLPEQVAARRYTFPSTNAPPLNPVGEQPRPVARPRRVRCWVLTECCCSRRRGSSIGTNRHIPLFWSSLGNRSPTKADLAERNTFMPDKPPPLTLHIRLSTGEDCNLDLINDRVTVLEAKRLLALRTNWPETRQRWFVCGHMLPNRARLCDCHIPLDFVIQVVVHSPFEPESQWRRFEATTEPSEQQQQRPQQQQKQKQQQSQQEDKHLRHHLQQQPDKQITCPTENCLSSNASPPILPTSTIPTSSVPVSLHLPIQ
ncbi:unnamed protein product [Calicophoron daubneyi]|uniref:DC-UbP/UBTD2 N-terminal domain-containing protein n=1 Tax=Calicophoron daubneyi TaxID=300641 RepID=A0AAV2SZL4_CALDB